MFLSAFVREGVRQYWSRRNAGILLMSQLLLLLLIGMTQLEATATQTLNAPLSKTHHPAFHPHWSIPTFSIVSVTADNSVTIETYNFPPNQDFNVSMGKMWTQGIGGENAGSFNSGAGGSNQYNFTIPASLHGQHQIAIRAQTNHPYPYPYYAYNWFYNNSTTTTLPVTTPPPTTVGYWGIPTLKICAVQKGNNVTIRTNNFPANQTFDVMIGAMGTRGVGGMPVGQIVSGAGGVIEQTFPLPAGYKNEYWLAIRAQTSHANPYYAFNWFYNNDATGFCKP